MYKNNPENYPDWEKYNPSNGHGQAGRFKTDILTCISDDCSRFNQGVSEREAFYLFATQGFFKRMKLVFLPSGMKSTYVCPFCERSDSLHPINNDISTF